MSAEANDRKLKLTGWLFHLGGVAVVLIGAAGYHFVVTKVITHQQRRNSAEIAELEALLETERETAREHARLQAELARLEASAEAARQRIPETPQESEFLAQVSAAAELHGLTIKNFTRGETTSLGTHSQMQIRLTGAGNYPSICGFFAEIATFSRVATVNNLTISNPGASNVYPVDMTMTLYFGARAAGGNHG